MGMEIIDWVNVANAVIAGASVLLHVLAPLKRTKKDDKIMAFIDKLLKYASLHKPQIEDVAVKVNKRKKKK